MPVISKTTIPHGGRQIDMTIRVNSDGVFRITLPEDVADDLGVSKEVADKDVDAAKRRFIALLQQHTQTKQVKRPVIFYLYKATAKIYSGDPDDDDTRTLYDEKDVSFSCGTAISLMVAKYEETETKLADGSSRFSYRWQKSSIPHGFWCSHHSDGPGHAEKSRPSGVIDWTEQREAFFTKLCRAMEGLVLQLHALTDDEKTLLLKADTGRFALTDERPVAQAKPPKKPRHSR